MAYELGDPSYRQGNHSLDMLIAYLPRKDSAQCGSLLAACPGAQLPTAPTPGQKTLCQNMLKLKLDVAQHVPIHGRVRSNEEFLRMFTNSARTNCGTRCKAKVKGQGRSDRSKR